MEKGLIGIVGGMGPEAGIALSANIISQTSAKSDQEHLPQILYSIPEYIPDRTEFLTGKIKTNPGHAISGILIKMESFGVKYAALACNSAHAPQIFELILSELAKNGSRIRLFHMVEEVGKFIRDHYRQLKKIGILGTTGTYITRQYDLLRNYELTTINLSAPEQKKLHQVIYHPVYGVKSNAGNIPEETRKMLDDNIYSLIKQGSELIVLGCTELPLAFAGRFFCDIPVIDSSIVMARALVKAHSPEKLKSWDS